MDINLCQISCVVRLIITYIRAEPTLHLACCVFQGQSPLSLPSLNEESPTKAHGEGAAQDTVSGGSCMQQVCKQVTWFLCPVNQDDCIGSSSEVVWVVLVGLCSMCVQNIIFRLICIM